MRKLSNEEIATLATRKNVRKIAVENFLGDFSGLTQTQVLANLRQDARSYNWNAPTVKAIEAGIRASFNNTVIPPRKATA